MTIIVELKGPDASQALEELKSNIQYDKLNVKVTVKAIKSTWT